jgi:DNA-binding beta-propeller fold protein YncE
MVVDLDNEKVVGDIPDTQGVHGVALAPSLGRGFISCGKADKALIFDLKTLKVLGEVKNGTKPDAILFDPASKLVFTFNGRSKDTKAFEAGTGKVVGTLPLGGKPEFAAADGKGQVYVNIEGTSEVAEIDTAKLAVPRRFSLKPGEEPSGLAFDARKGLVFPGCSNKMMTVLDLKSGKVVDTVPIGEGVDGNGFDPDTGLVFSSNGEGTITVAKESSAGKFEVLETVTTQRGARTMALDPKTHRIYLPTVGFGPPPAPTADNPRPRPAILQDTFVVLVAEK